MYKPMTSHMTQDDRREALKQASEAFKDMINTVAALNSIEATLEAFKVMNEVKDLVSFWQLEVEHHEERKDPLTSDYAYNRYGGINT